MSDYEVLKAMGHTPAKAAEIALDAKRGDEYAVAWIEAARQMATERSASQAH